ncbi:MAG TPA: T9SS type A sorting domain-containing protein, partial [Tenuifilaceae bacterium]|nr:T9SS type A sorting domain-containing protein [Tenuifilaceae bacterium]
LEKPCVANLIVCDGNGKIIATLAQGELGGGNQTITWLTRNQPNGIYLVALRANGRQFSQKLVVNH